MTAGSKLCRRVVAGEAGQGKEGGGKGFLRKMASWVCEEWPWFALGVLSCMGMLSYTFLYRNVQGASWESLNRNDRVLTWMATVMIMYKYGRAEMYLMVKSQRNLGGSTTILTKASQKGYPSSMWSTRVAWKECGHECLEGRIFAVIKEYLISFLLFFYFILESYPRFNIFYSRVITTLSA